MSTDTVIDLLHVIDDTLQSIERSALIMRDGRNAAGLRALCLGLNERPERIDGADVDTLYAMVHESCLETTASLAVLTHNPQKTEEAGHSGSN